MKKHLQSERITRDISKSGERFKVGKIAMKPTLASIARRYLEVQRLREQLSLTEEAERAR